MANCFLLLGTNMGDKVTNLLQVRHLILQNIGIIVNVSSIYQTDAWGKMDQDDFLNQVLEVQTDLMPNQLLIECLELERQMGRERFEKWGERLIDIDILYYNDLVIEEENLNIPHPEIQHRRFTLIPLVEVAPDFLHPVLLRNNAELLQMCKDSLHVKIFEPKSKDQKTII